MKKYPTPIRDTAIASLIVYWWIALHHDFVIGLHEIMHDFFG